MKIVTTMKISSTVCLNCDFFVKLQRYDSCGQHCHCVDVFVALSSDELATTSLKLLKWVVISTANMNVWDRYCVKHRKFEFESMF